MSLPILAFWLALLVPGHAIARRLDPEGVESGPLSAIALSFLAAVVALAAVMIPGYVLGVPIVVLSAAIVGFVLWGAADLVRSRRWAAIGRLCLAAICLEVGVVLVDMLLSGRIGTLLGADAIVHVARVRFLLEQGLGNGDPFIGGHFYPIYHTNFIHALLASACQITGEDPLTVWSASLPFAKLLVVSGAWYVGWALFRNPVAAWATALFVLGSRGPVTFMLYPNQLAPWFLIPVLLGFLVRAVADGPRRPHALGIAASALAIGGTHGMYAIFATMAVGPALAVWVATQWLRATADRRGLAACLIALAAGLPFPATTFLATRAASKPAAATEKATGPIADVAAEVDVEADPLRLAVAADDAADEEDDETDPAEAAAPGPTLPAVSNRFHRLDNGLVMHKFGRGFTGNRGLRVWVLAMGAALAVIAGHRRETLLLLGVLLSVAVWLHVPPLCTLLLRAGGAEWIVLRLASLMDVLLAVLVPGSVAAVAAAAMRHREETDRLSPLVLRWSLGASCLHAGAFFAAQQSPYDWRTYLDRGRMSASALRGGQLDPLLRLARDLEGTIPSNAVVLADPSIGMRVVMAHDCRVVTSTSSSVGVRGIGTRTRHARRMLRNGTSPEQRDALLERYGVTHVVAERPAPAWTLERMEAFHPTEFGWCIITLRDPGSPPGPVAGDYDMALADAGRIDEAIEVLQQRVEQSPDHFGSRFRLGRMLHDGGRLLDAVESFELALSIRPEDPRPAIMIGNAYSDLEWYDEAIEAYRRTVAIATRVNDRRAIASAEFNTANTHYRLGRWDEAVAAYRAALAADPTHAGAAQWLPMAEAAAGERSE